MIYLRSLPIKTSEIFFSFLFIFVLCNLREARLENVYSQKKKAEIFQPKFLRFSYQLLECLQNQDINSLLCFLIDSRSQLFYLPSYFIVSQTIYNINFHLDQNCYCAFVYQTRASTLYSIIYSLSPIQVPTILNPARSKYGFKLHQMQRYQAS